MSTYAVAYRADEVDMRDYAVPGYLRGVRVTVCRRQRNKQRRARRRAA